MRQQIKYYNFISLLTWEEGEKKCAVFAQFLRSFGKQWEAALPTFLLIINELDKKCEKKKKLTKWEAVGAQIPVK